MRGVRVPADKQGLLFFMCRNYSDMPQKTRDKIDYICDKASCGVEPYRKALFAMLTTRDSVTAISMKFCVGQTKLYDMRRQFYELWYKEKAGA